MRTGTENRLTLPPDRIHMTEVTARITADGMDNFHAATLSFGLAAEPTNKSGRNSETGMPVIWAMSAIRFGGMLDHE